MRQAVLALPAIALAALALPAQAETRSFNLTGFDGVSASALMEVVLKQGPYSVKVDEPKGRFDDLKLEVHGSTLMVSRKDNHNVQRKEDLPAYTVIITAPSIKDIQVSSVSSVEGKDIKFRDLKVNVSSAGKVRLTGACAMLDLNASSAGEFDGDDLKCETAKANVSSGARADAFASKSAAGNASSGATITFHGKPADVTRTASSGGSVRTF